MAQSRSISAIMWTLLSINTLSLVFGGLMAWLGYAIPARLKQLGFVPEIVVGSGFASLVLACIGLCALNYSSSRALHFYGLSCISLVLLLVIGLPDFIYKPATSSNIQLTHTDNSNATEITTTRRNQAHRSYLIRDLVYISLISLLSILILFSLIFAHHLRLKSIQRAENLVMLREESGARDSNATRPFDCHHLSRHDQCQSPGTLARSRATVERYFAHEARRVSRQSSLAAPLTSEELASRAQSLVCTCQHRGSMLSSNSERFQSHDNGGASASPKGSIPRKPSGSLMTEPTQSGHEPSMINHNQAAPMASRSMVDVNEQEGSASCSDRRHQHQASGEAGLEQSVHSGSGSASASASSYRMSLMHWLGASTNQQQRSSHNNRNSNNTCNHYSDRAPKDLECTPPFSPYLATTPRPMTPLRASGHQTTFSPALPLQSIHHQTHRVVGRMGRQASRSTLIDNPRSTPIRHKTPTASGSSSRSSNRTHSAASRPLNATNCSNLINTTTTDEEELISLHRHQSVLHLAAHNDYSFPPPRAPSPPVPPFPINSIPGKRAHRDSYYHHLARHHSSQSISRSQSGHFSPPTSTKSKENIQQHRTPSSDCPSEELHFNCHQLSQHASGPRSSKILMMMNKIKGCPDKEGIATNTNPSDHVLLAKQCNFFGCSQGKLAPTGSQHADLNYLNRAPSRAETLKSTYAIRNWRPNNYKTITSSNRRQGKDSNHGFRSGSSSVMAMTAAAAAALFGGVVDTSGLLETSGSDGLHLANTDLGPVELEEHMDPGDCQCESTIDTNQGHQMQASFSTNQPLEEHRDVGDFRVGSWPAPREPLLDFGPLMNGSQRKNM